MPNRLIKIKFQVTENISPEELEKLLEQIEKVEINGYVFDYKSGEVVHKKETDVKVSGNKNVLN